MFMTVFSSPARQPPQACRHQGPDRPPARTGEQGGR